MIITVSSAIDKLVMVYHSLALELFLMDRDPLRATATVRYLLNAWHSTTSAPAEGDALMEEDSHKRTAVAESGLYCNVLHRVLYPQVHGNGLKKKKNAIAMYDMFTSKLKLAEQEDMSRMRPR